MIGRKKIYPYPEGEFTVLGPEIFVSADGKVICWKGVNYVPQPPPEDDACRNCEHARHAPGECTDGTVSTITGCRCTWG